MQGVHMSEAGKVVRVIIGATFFAWPAVCLAQTLYPTQAVSLSGTTKCNVFTIGWIINTTGPCRDADLPRIIAIGSAFAEGGKQHRVNFIKATVIKSDFPEMQMKAGDWMCVAGESKDDIDPDSNKSRRVWLVIPQCAGNIQ